MCLTELHNTINHNIRFGYKVFYSQRKTEASFLFNSGYRIDRKMGYNFVPYMPTGVWVEALSVPVFTLHGNKKYISGFHFFELFDNAKEYLEIYSESYHYPGVVKKIEVRHILASGIQDKIPCLVAKRIKILKDNPCA